MTARYAPKVGDYWVVQSDGYAYLNPAEVFERKYRAQDEGVGATGEFPQGKLNKHDEGELRMRIGHKGTEVLIEFGKPVAWVGMPKDNALEFARKVKKAADALPAVQ